MSRSNSGRIGLLLPVAVVLVLVFAGVFSGRPVITPCKVADHEKSSPERIVSLAPSITEALFDLGLGDRIVGVTDYCLYPSPALEITKIGGYIDPSLESIVKLRPDLVVMHPDHHQIEGRLKTLKVPVLVVKQTRFDEVSEAFRVIGDACGAAEQGVKLSRRMKDSVEMIQEKIRDVARPRVLLTIGRDFTEKNIALVYAAAPNSFHDQILQHAGGQNVLTDGSIPYPAISAESLIMMNPDVIVDLIPDPERQSLTIEAIRDSWSNLKSISAVKNNRIYILSGDYVSIPGMRTASAVKDLAALLHPDVFGKQ